MRKALRLCGFVSTLLLAAGFGWSGQVRGEEAEARPHLQMSVWYSFDGYSQNNFLLGRPLAVDPQGRTGVGPVSDHDEYAIQVLRLQTEFGVGENLKAVIRSDWAQGIWGIDDDPRTGGSRPGFSPIFDGKDTNFGIHVDWAYLDYTHAPWSVNGKVGRMKSALGNLLVLDQDADAIQLTKVFSDKSSLSVAWAMISEGSDALSDEDAIGPDEESALDATLYALQYRRSIGPLSVNPFVAFYEDAGDEDQRTYLPQGQQYLLARFQPQVSQALAAGVAFEGKKGRLECKGEVDVLIGQDHVRNGDSGPNQLLDVNNGDLQGSNLYLDGKASLGPGKLGVVLGMGSGDDDPMGGKGNINRIRTQGFFYVTEVWEDSIMPDEEGITPQGLGSPASRGYRELENTTLAQLNWTWSPHAKLTHFTSATLIRATEPLHPWADKNDNRAIDPGELGDEESSDLGKEIDTMLTLSLHPNLKWTLRGGIFLPGDAAGYLIHGLKEWKNDDGSLRELENAWEIRTTLSCSIAGLKIGG